MYLKNNIRNCLNTMKIEFAEVFIESAIKNYLKSIDHKGRLEQFEKDIIDNPVKTLQINGTFFTSAIQLQDAIKDAEDVYYDGVLIIPYRYWLMKSNNRCKNSELDSLDESHDSVNS